MVTRPHAVEGATLRLHRGHLGSAAVSLDSVVSAAPIHPEAIARLSEPPARLDLGGERVLVTLREPVAYSGAFGRSRRARTLVVSADDPGALCDAVAAR
ncbi:MAG TPA: hypothetical protein VIF15_10425 [Polyangiaceae bacterium]